MFLYPNEPIRKHNILQGIDKYMLYFISVVYPS